jgi:glycosyltransferase involved in cell wall biosynthesis
MIQLKTLHIIGSKALGGAERSFSRIVAALNRAGVRAEAVVRAGSTVPQILPADVATHLLPLRTVWDPLSRFEVGKLIRQTRPDIVQTYMGRATRLTHLPAGKRPIHVARLCGNYQPRHFVHAHAWVACTRWVADYLLAGGIPAHKLSLIPNFLPTLPVATGEELAAARADWNLAESDLVIGAIGRLQRIKGFDVLIEAFARLPREIDGRRPVLAIAGEGELESALTKLAAHLGLGDRLRLLGWTNRPDLLLRLSDVVAFTSRPNEGFGNVTLETWDAGTPLVTTRSKGASETTRHLDTAWQVPCEDPAALAEGLLTVLSDRELAARLVAAGRQELAIRYSEDAVIRQFVELYTSLTR